MTIIGKIVFNRVSKGSKGDRIAAFLETKDELLAIRIKDGNPFMQVSELKEYENKNVEIKDAKIQRMSNGNTVFVKSKKNITIM